MSEPQTPMQEITDEALELFTERAEERGVPIVRAAFFAVAENNEAVSGGYGFDDQGELFGFLLSYTQQLARALGFDVTIIDPDQN